MSMLEVSFAILLTLLANKKIDFRFVSDQMKIIKQTLQHTEVV